MHINSKTSENIFSQIAFMEENTKKGICYCWHLNDEDEG